METKKIKLLSPFLPVISFGAAAASSPTKIIVDTDMGMDVDDVGAVTLANALHMSGEA